jgi:hypothetical protein
MLHENVEVIHLGEFIMQLHHALQLAVAIQLNHGAPRNDPSLINNMANTVENGAKSGGALDPSSSDGIIIGYLP